MKHKLQFLCHAVLLVVLTASSFAQVAGDFRTVAGLTPYNATTSPTSVWSNAACWETYNGSTWSAAATAPTTTANVTIVSGDTIFFDPATTVTVASLTISAGGSMSITSGGIDCPTITVNGGLIGSGNVNFAATGNIVCSGASAVVKFGSSGAKITGVSGKTFTLSNGATLTPCVNNGAPPGTGNIISTTFTNMTVIFDNSAALTTVSFKNSGSTTIQNPPNGQVYGNLSFTTSTGAGLKTISIGENIIILGNLSWAPASTAGWGTGEAAAWGWNLAGYKIRTLGTGKTVTVTQVSNHSLLIYGTADTLLPGFASYNFLPPSNGNCRVSYAGSNQVVLGGTYQRLLIGGTGDFPLTGPVTVKDTLILNSGNLNNSVYQVSLYRSPVITSGTISQAPTVGVKESTGSIPERCTLNQNYPNPFNPSTSFTYQVAKTGFVSLKVYDMLGREVATLVNEVKPAGTYPAIWNASSFGSGIYFAKMQSGSFTETKKMLLVK